MVLNTTKKKTGRPGAIYRTRDGQQIIGLMRLSDGRWRASGPEKFTYTEIDEQLAIARFHQWESRKGNETVAVPQAGARLDDGEGIKKSILAVTPDAEGGDPIHGIFLPEGKPAKQSRGAKRVTPIRMEVTGDRLEFFRDPVLAESFWPWLRRLILDKPQYVALMTGIEQIGFLQNLPRPTKSPTLKEVGDLYFTTAKLSENWKAKCAAFWKQFCDSVEVLTLRELDQEKLVEYSDEIKDVGETGTYVRQRFGAIKAIINYPTKRGKWAEDSKRALALCGVLVPPRMSATDPHPISPENFHKLYKAADAKMKAMLLTGLNFCMYLSEVVALKWDEIDFTKGVLITERNKSGMLRIAVLWPETIAALKQLPREGDYVFMNGHGPHNYQTAYKLFKALRKAATVKGVQSADLRDGGYTASVEANVELAMCKLLAGHSIGISDAYLKRKPTMVARACEAIRKTYFDG